MIRRRQFLTLLGGAATAWPVVVLAQQGDRVRRIGVMIGGATERSAVGQAQAAALVQGLRELGWTEGRNLRIDYRWPADDTKRMEADAIELVALGPELIVVGTAPAVVAAARATSSLPIVQVNGADPAALGLVPSLAHPGGNITGFSATEPSISGKWLDVLKEIAPSITRALILQNTENPNRRLYFPWIEATARVRNVQLTMPEFNKAAEIAPILEQFASAPSGGLIVLPGPFTGINLDLIIALAIRNRLPSVHAFPQRVQAGGLVSYGVDVIDTFHRSASYVDRILKGAKPSELPFQLADKYVLAINLKTAKALGLTVPPSLLTRADEVIE